MDTLQEVGKKVIKVGKKMGEKVGETFGPSKSSKKYTKSFSGKNYVEIERCLIEVAPTEMRDIYSGHPEKVSGTTEEQQKCLKEFAKKKRAKFEQTKRRKISEITEDELNDLEYVVSENQFKRVKKIVEDARKIKVYMKHKEDPILKHDSGDSLFDPFEPERKRVVSHMQKIDKSSFSKRSDESDDSINRFEPEILVDEIRIPDPTIEEILDNSKSYMIWKRGIDILKNKLIAKKGGKSRKMNRKTRRNSNRKTRRR